MRICICNVPHNWGEIFSDTAIDADSRPLRYALTVPIDRIISVKNAHGSQWISNKINIRHPGQLKK